MPPLAYETAHSLVPVRPFNPVTWRSDQRARLQRMAANAVSSGFPPPRIVIDEPEPEPVPEDRDVAATLANGTVVYRYVSGPPPRPVLKSPRVFLRAVARHYDVEIDQIRARRRDAAIMPARMMSYWFLRKYTTASYPTIGAALGGRDHTSVLHGVRRIDARIAAGDPATMAAVEAIKAALGVG